MEKENREKITELNFSHKAPRAQGLLCSIFFILFVLKDEKHKCIHVIFFFFCFVKKKSRENLQLKNFTFLSIFGISSVFKKVNILALLFFLLFVFKKRKIERKCLILRVWNVISTTRIEVILLSHRHTSAASASRKSIRTALWFERGCSKHI